MIDKIEQIQSTTKELIEALVMKAEVEERLGRSLETSMLDTALCKVQSKMKPVGKDSKGYNYTYADLEDVVEAARPILCEYGISVTQPIIMDGDKLILKTIVSHDSGQFRVSKMPIMEPKASKPGDLEKDMGKTITYFRRYAYASFLNIICTNDPDHDTPEYISKNQFDILNHEIGDNAELKQRILKWANIKELGQLPKSNFETVLERIKKK